MFARSWKKTELEKAPIVPGMMMKDWAKMIGMTPDAFTRIGT